MKRICTIFLFLTCLAVLLTSCGNSDTNERQDATASSDNVETITDTIDKPTPKVSEVDLVHTYTTRFEEVNLVTYPAFSFGYSDNWSVTKEDVTPTSEWVTLSNERGATIDFINIHEKSIGGGSAVVYTEVEVSKVADSNFTPGYVQATDYSDLGKFMVAELKTVGTMDTMTDKDFVPVEDGSVSYAVLPESSIGQHTVNSAYYMDLAFWYSGNTLLLASAPDGQFEPQEEKEVIAILSSFRDKSAPIEATNTPSNPTATGDIKTIDELWELLAGEWECEDYQYLGKTYFADGAYSHVMELQYIDNQPCMNRSRFGDVVFNENEFIVADEVHYDAYIYKRGVSDPKDGNWSDDVKATWYRFDLSSLSDEKLTVYYYILFDNDFLDNHTFIYSHG